MSVRGFNPLFFKTGPDMPVASRLPPGVVELRYAKPRKAVGKGNRQFHYCGECGGWIEGAALCQTEDDLPEFKEGRRGRVIRCRRMGHELAFFGVYNKEAEKVDAKSKATSQQKPSPITFRITRGTGGIPQ